MSLPSVLVTGGAGFIGSHLVDRLLREGYRVTVIDNLDQFYDPAIKLANLKASSKHPNFALLQVDIRNRQGLQAAARGRYDVIVHLAAKAGIGPSITNPFACEEVNVLGTQNLLELARTWDVQQFVFASSSSVYGVNRNVPWREEESVLLPISPYAGTKISGELLGHVYSHLYGIRFIALRFFTAYGPRQRPDLVIHKFARLMLEGKPLPYFGDGSSRRDYTYIDDVVSGIRAAMDYSGSRYEVINIGNNQAISLSEVVFGLESALQVKAQLDRYPEQPGDVPETWADVSKAKKLLAYEPAVTFSDGLNRFVAWLTKDRAYPADHVSRIFDPAEHFHHLPI